MKLFLSYYRIGNNTDYLYSGFSAGICVLANDLHGIVSYLQNHNLKYRTLKDGDVIIEDLNSLDNNLSKKAR